MANQISWLWCRLCGQPNNPSADPEIRADPCPAAGVGVTGKEEIPLLPPQTRRDGQGASAILEHRVWRERGQSPAAKRGDTAQGHGRTWDRDVDHSRDGAPAAEKSLPPAEQQFVELLPGSGIKN